MTSFEFATAGRIVFGLGTLNRLGDHVIGRAKRVLLVRGSPSDASQRILKILSGLDIQELELHGEPSVQTAREGAAIARGCDMVIGLGGGSALDSGKALAALASNPGDVLDYLEVVGKGQALINPPLPYIAIPTTAGTGSEVTRNAVLESAEHGIKASLRSPMMLPSLALVDPELTYSLPPSVTASTGLDALTQLIEPFVSVKSNPLTDALCREGMQRAARSLRAAYDDGADPSAREDMALASLLSGMALANAGLGAVHGFAGPLGAMLHAPHGAVCARLLPFVMEANLRAMQERAPQHPALERYTEIGRILTGQQDASFESGLAWIQRITLDLKIPPLSEYGLTTDRFEEAVSKTLLASSFKGNPLPLTADELLAILEKAL